MTKQQHNIEKISVNVNTSSSQIGNLYKDSLPHLINSEFLKDADKLFSSVCTENEKRIIEKINIELNIEYDTDFSFLRQQLIFQLKERLKEAEVLNNMPNSDHAKREKDSRSPKKYGIIDGYVYFLKTGLKPWWVSNKKLDDILKGNWENAFQNLDNYSFIIDKILLDIAIQNRFLKQQNDVISIFYYFHKKELTSSIRAKLKVWKAENEKFSYELRVISLNETYPLILELIAKKSKLSSIISKIEVVFQNIFRKWLEINSKQKRSEVKNKFKPWTEKSLELFSALSNHIIDQKSIDESIVKMLQNTEKTSSTIKTNTNIKTKNSKEKKLFEKEILTNPEEELPTIYLNHAGLVIVYPFIKELFKSCKMLSNSGEIISEDTAVHLLYYVATKKLRPAEYEMTLEKILCGIPIHTPIEKEITLSEHQVNEAEEMLKALSEHWAAIKNSSPDAMRNTFLCREGKLEIDDFDKKLFIQRKTEDILIDRLPWNISIVKTPWMKQFLTVEW